MARYPTATWRPSPARHDHRTVTLGVCIHNTYGREAGDLATLTGGQVDCHFYVARSGRVYQLLDTDSTSWTAKATANRNSLHIETEGRRDDAWTIPQAEAVARLVAWLCDRYGVPVGKVDPPGEWRGLYDHRDLQGVNGNDHGDGVPPTYPGWPRFVRMVETAGHPRPTLAQRLRRAGLGPRSVKKIIERLRGTA